MGTFDLAKVANTMGKVIKSLDLLQPYLKGYFSIESHKEELMAIAYMCRIGIIDLIEGNKWMQNNNLPILIPLGIIKRKKTTMENALEMTLGRLKMCCNDNDSVYIIIMDILRKGQSFYKLQSTISKNCI